MDRQQLEPRDPVVGAPGVDRVLGEPVAYSAGTTSRGTLPSAFRVSENDMPVRDRVQWGPIVAGSLISLGVLILLTMLGVAIGASAFEPGADLTDWGTGAGIYGGLSALIALFAGGWVAAKSAAVDGPYAGTMNGLLAGLTTIVVLLVASSLGIANILGFLGGNLGDITGFAGGVVESADADAQAEAFNNIENGAWGTLVALIVALAAAALGGTIGHNDRHDLAHGTGAV